MFCGKASFTSKQSEKNSRGPQLQSGRRENTVTCLSGRDSGGSRTNSCQSPNTCSISCSGWNDKGRLEDTSDMSLLSKHIYFRKEDNWGNLVEGICLIIKINIYIEIQFNLVTFLTFSYFYKSHRGLIHVFSSWVGKDPVPISQEMDYIQLLLTTTN